MPTKDLKSMYKNINRDSFPPQMEISFSDDNGKQTLIYEKAFWNIDGVRKGLRYGENPDQEAALYKLVNGNLALGDVQCIQPGQYLASDTELIQSGKHPGKINITDADAALNILRYFSDSPCTVIIKHNNPCGVALDDSLATSYEKALMADRVAAFGGAVALNRSVDRLTAEKIINNYHEVIIAPDFEEGVLDLFAAKKNLRVMKIANITKLSKYVGKRFLDLKALIDGGMVAQWSWVPAATNKDLLIKAETVYRGNTYSIDRFPTEAEYKDMIFGWLVESGITSNSVIYVKDGATIGIGTGEQDRVGVAEIARDKAYRKLADRICWEKHATPFNLMHDEAVKDEINNDVNEIKGGLIGSVMVSDAFFPFRDGIEVGLKEGVSAVIQPGGSLRDFESIEACNEYKAAMMYTGQRSFRH